MDVQEKLDELIGLIENARSVPMSASCIVNRAEVLAMLQDIRDTLPEEINHARMLLSDREAVIEEGRREAERIINGAREAQGSLLSGTEVMREAQLEAQRIVEQARQEAFAIRQEADDYVDQKLANFEVVLNKTLATVQKGRERLSGRQEMDALGEHVQAMDQGGYYDDSTQFDGSQSLYFGQHR